MPPARRRGRRCASRQRARLRINVRSAGRRSNARSSQRRASAKPPFGHECAADLVVGLPGRDLVVDDEVFEGTDRPDPDRLAERAHAPRHTARARPARGRARSGRREGGDDGDALLAQRQRVREPARRRDRRRPACASAIGRKPRGVAARHRDDVFELLARRRRDRRPSTPTSRNCTRPTGSPARPRSAARLTRRLRSPLPRPA